MYYVLKAESIKTVIETGHETQTKTIYDPRHPMLSSEDIGVAVGFFKEKIQKGMKNIILCAESVVEPAYKAGSSKLWDVARMGLSKKFNGGVINQYWSGLECIMGYDEHNSEHISNYWVDVIVELPNGKECMKNITAEELYRHYLSTSTSKIKGSAKAYVIECTYADGRRMKKEIKPITYMTSVAMQPFEISHRG